MKKDLNKDMYRDRNKPYSTEERVIMIILSKFLSQLRVEEINTADIQEVMRQLFRGDKEIMNDKGLTDVISDICYIDPSKVKCLLSDVLEVEAASRGVN